MQSIFTVNRTALVTGASAGIGLELTKALAPKLYSVILVARRFERLEEIAKELRSRYPALKIAIEAVDLSDPEAVQHFLDQRLPMLILTDVGNVGDAHDPLAQVYRVSFHASSLLLAKSFRKLL